jgi:glycosyltransferase involved in cell wall biosynthesis
MTDQPVISVLLPVYNGERFLAEALDSLLRQTYCSFELIVINDGSQDKSAEILESYRRKDARIEIFHQKNQGLIASLNRGLSLARGRYLARMDADDISLPDRLETQVQYMEQHPEVALIGCACDLIDEQGKWIGREHQPAEDTQIRWQLLFHNAIAHSAAFFRMDLIREYELPYSTKAIHSEDYELWTRLLAHGFGHNLPEILIRRRVHPQQISTLDREKVWKTASQISQTNIRNLGIELSFSEVVMLRDWFYHFPRKLKPADLSIGNQLIRILNSFSNISYLNPADVSKIRGRWIGKILAALPLEKGSFFSETKILAQLRPGDLVNLARYLRSR